MGSKDRAQFFTLLDAALASRMVLFLFFETSERAEKKKKEKAHDKKQSGRKKNSKKKSQVPAYSAASFAKKFARLALNAPPAGALLCLTFVNNVLRRHPATSTLLHRRGGKVEAEAEAGKGNGGGGGGGGSDGEEQEKKEAAASPPPPPPHRSSALDPFDPSEPDTALTRAIESSLWEVAHLSRRHSAPAVAAAARAILSDPGLVPSAAANPKAAAKLASAEADPRPAAAATYGSMVAEALAKRVKRAPLVAVTGSGGGGGGARNGGSGGGGRGDDASSEGLMLFGGGAWSKGWKRSNVGGDGVADADAAAALAGEA